MTTSSIPSGVGFKPLTEEQIEAWRAWKNTGNTVDFDAGSFDVLCDMALASLALPLPGCGHASQYAYSENGGKDIICLLCERAAEKPDVASLEVFDDRIASLFSRDKYAPAFAVALAALLRLGFFEDKPSRDRVIAFLLNANLPERTVEQIIERAIA